MGKRANGEGTIFQLPSGRWRADITTGLRTPKGKPIRKSVTGKTQKEVREKVEKLKRDLAGGIHVQSGPMSVRQLLEMWLAEKRQQGTIRPSTQRFYGDVIKRQVLPWLGTLQLAKLQPIQVQQFMQVLANHGATPHQRHHTYGILSQAFDFAMKLNLIGYNPMSRVDKPKLQTRKHTALDEEQVKRLLEEAKSDRLFALYYLAIATGMRQGELFGLQWQDVDMTAGTLLIQRIVSELGSEIVFGEPKTPKSRRMIPISETTAAVLRRHQALQVAEGHQVPWVFCNSNGGPLRRSNVLHRSFKPMLERTGLPSVRFHDLRHTSASHMLRKGVNIKVVSDMLGHSQISITLDTYAHVFPESKREAAIKLDEMLSAIGSEP